MGGPGNMGGGGGGRGPLTVEDVRSWLNTQQPFVLQNVMKHCSNLLTNKHGQSVDDLSVLDTYYYTFKTTHFRSFSDWLV